LLVNNPRPHHPLACITPSSPCAWTERFKPPGHFPTLCLFIYLSCLSALLANPHSKLSRTQSLSRALLHFHTVSARALHGYIFFLSQRPAILSEPDSTTPVRVLSFCLANTQPAQAKVLSAIASSVWGLCAESFIPCVHDCLLTGSFLLLFCCAGRGRGWGRRQEILSVIDEGLR
jgi:hypothetical protein